jgi:hypothetical protein
MDKEIKYKCGCGNELSTIMICDKCIEIVEKKKSCWCSCQFEGDGCRHIGVEETCNHPGRKHT